MSRVARAMYGQVASHSRARLCIYARHLRAESVAKIVPRPKARLAASRVATGRNRRTHAVTLGQAATNASAWWSSVRLNATARQMKRRGPPYE
jgi:hypothetical protein